MADSEQMIQSAFSSDAALCDRILAAARQNRDNLQLFVDMARYVSSRIPPTQENGHGSSQSKKRKLDDGHAVQNGATTASGAISTIFTATEISFSAPMRKKMTLELVDQDGVGLLRVLSPADQKVEYSIALHDIDQIFALPVPDKAQRAQNFVVFPLPSSPSEQLVFTMLETAPKTLIQTTPPSNDADSDANTYATVTARLLNTRLAPLGKRITTPTAASFTSAIPQPHRRAEPAFHIKAHRGSKEGYLFLTAAGIVWGFKKPLALFALESVESVSYTSVLQRTFNLVVESLAGADGAGQGSATQEVEFAMIDQADFAGIDAYVKMHGLQDASMAQQRRAKKLNVNGRRGADAAGVGHAQDGGAHAAAQEEEEESELQKAEQQMLDAEDEEEEDYDPGSEGESEGEGESDEGDDEEGGIHGGEDAEEEEEEEEDDEGDAEE